MAKNSIRKISSAFATGGGGINFEQQIHAMFLLSLLIDGFCPAMNERTKRVCFQAKHLGYDVDDLVVFTFRNQNEGKMLCQIKHKVTATVNDLEFQEVICAAWSDFNKDNFDEENDRIALATAQISNSALRALRFLHAQAIGSIDEQDFIERVQKPVFSNSENGNMLDTIKKCVAIAKNSEPSDAEIWHFCKVFILLMFDVDCEESINRALASSLIRGSSPMNALLVWSKIVEYAGRCNQTAASIDRKNIDNTIRELFLTEQPIQIMPEPITKIDLFIPTIALIGAWREDNSYDRQIIEKVSGLDYTEFEAKARKMVSQNSEYLKLVNGGWSVLHKEELLSQCKKMLFDDCLERLFEATYNVLTQNSKRVASKTPYYISSGSDYNNSHELRTSLVNSICWIKENLNDLPNCNCSKTEWSMIQLVRNLLEKADWTTWRNLSDCLQRLAEIAPSEFLDRVEWNVLHKSEEILRLFPQKDSDIFGSNNYISELLWSLEILAWSPDYLIKAICILGLLEDLPYEQTNWVNTPINSIVSILLPWYPQTLGNLEKRKSALRSLKNDNPDIFWKVLKKILPDHTSTTSGNPKPRYILSVPEEIKITHTEVYECYAYLLELAVDTVCDETEKQIDLVDQIGYMHESTLTKYLDCLEECLENYTPEFAFSLWTKLREQLVLIRPTNEMVIYNYLDRINRLIEKLEPKDKRLKYQELYRDDRCLFEKGDYTTAWKRIESEKEIAIKDIFDCFGIEDTERFGHSVKNLHDVASKLGRSITVIELSGVIKACSLNKVSRDFLASCVTSFAFTNGANSLLKTSLRDMNREFVLDILTRITFDMQLFKVIEELLPDDSAYWERASMPFACLDKESEELLLIVNKLSACKRYVTAINIIGRSDFDSIIDAKYICDLLMLAGTEESTGREALDSYSAQKIIGWLQKQESIDLYAKSDIEFIYLPVLNESSEIQPHALYTRISLDADYFCGMLELFYKKRSENNHEEQLNKGLGDRLFEILFHFKVIPGNDWNGVFHADKFRLWMNTVKSWSKENDRYEVAMHTVGSGLAYAKLDDKHLPERVIIEELNKAENNELRRGYYLGVVNQRGAHFIDPEGKPELELAKEYRSRANNAELIGYSRYADVLREIADQYSKEAEHNIASAQNRKED